VLKALARRLRALLGGPRAAPGADYYRLSFSQEGEDLVLLSLFEGVTTGFFVDVGAHHPRKYSNTFALYERGWRGINIDAMPGSMAAFRAMRPRDINLELAISDKRETLTFFEFNEPALSGFDPDVAHAREGVVPPGSPESAAFHIVAERQIKTVTLAETLDAHLPPGQAIDLLSVDVEGGDLAVLASSDWARHRPTLVLVEDAAVESMLDLSGSPVAQFLRARGYVPICRTRLTFFYAREDCVVRGILGLGLAAARRDGADDAAAGSPEPA